MKGLKAWISLLLVLEIGASCNSFVPRQEWSENKLELTLKSGIQIRLGATEGPEEELRFEAVLPGQKIKPSAFWRTPNWKRGPAFEKTAEGFREDRYLIQPDDQGFRILRDGQPAVRLVFESSFGRIKVRTEYPGHETFYGMGGVSDHIPLNGQDIVLYQKAQYGNQNYINIPFFFSSSGNAFYFNGSLGDKFSFSQGDATSVTDESLEASLDGSYYWGPDPQSIVRHFYRGQTPEVPPPKWSFGYIQSRFGYRSQEEVTDLMDGFGSRNLYPDGLVLDLYWFKNMGDLDWDRENFPDPEAMAKDLHSKGVHLITITEPYYRGNSLNFGEWAKKKYFVTEESGEALTWESWWGEGSMINLWAPGAAQALGQKYVNMVKTGIDSFWTDLGEPEDSPDEAIYGPFTKNDVHNYYNREWSRIIFNAVHEAYPNKRFFILSRSAYTGSTKYDVAVWSGDSSSSFEGLAKQTGIGENLGLSGLPYFGSDVGGFHSHGRAPDGELFVRWHQASVFHPMYRAHGNGPREPWASGPEAEKRILDQIRLRKELVPYFYSLAWATREGQPMMTPLFYQMPEWKPGWTDNTAFFSGPAFLVYPVTKPLDQQKTMNVTLPPGRWKTFPDGPILSGGEQTLPLTLDRIPVFLREGAIVPRLQDGQLDFLVFPGPRTTEFTYTDDEDGPLVRVKVVLESHRVRFQGFPKAGSIQVTLVEGSGSLRKKTVDVSGNGEAVWTW